MTTQQYIENLHQRYQAGNATEHTFRGDLQQLIESLVPNIRATNEPKRQACGAPDFILTKKDIPIGFIEAKDIGDKDLDGLKKTGNKAQFDRYKTSLNNIFFTDYIDFHLFREGQFVTKIAIAELTEKGIKPLTENFARFERLLKDFCTNLGQTINNSKKLAEMLAAKARLLAEVIEKSLISDETHREDSTLKEQMTAFRQILIHDITPKAFADVYAQTIAYGMFAARYHDPTLPTFSRQEAYQLIPKTNPFLKKLFGYIAGLDVDDRIKWIVDDLVNIFLACDVAEFFNVKPRLGVAPHGVALQEDPIIHFYETFLSEYDPALRKSRGVWYTPQPVVNFIVRAVDDILKTEFNLPQGLADTSKIKLPVGTPATANVEAKAGVPTGFEGEVHKVQILDPATGTGTFLAEVVKHIYNNFEGQQGAWSNYVETNLLPRLNGFELLMASYAMAHLKLDMLLTETGYRTDARSSFSTTNERFRVFLTNSLEEQHPDTQTLFASWLSDEANGANQIKRESPLMVILGNPPYAVSSSNKGGWIQKLIADYKKNLNERSYNSLSDDYVKFIRLGQHFIDKNGSGVLAYISNNSFIDGVVFRQMRKHLLETFDKIYILDLHGNAKKKETCPDGSPDQNVFDIMQGVSINIFVKTSKKEENKLGQVFHYDLYGKRNIKYAFLHENNLNSVSWNILQATEPNFYFVRKDFSGNLQYEQGFRIDSLFVQNSSGVETRKDSLVISISEKNLKTTIDDFKTLDIEQLTRKYHLDDNSRDWKISSAKKDILTNNPQILNILYRPFDIRKIIYTGKTKGINGYPMYANFKHLILGSNLGLIIKRGFDNPKSSFGFITTYISDRRAWSNPGMQGAENIFPLYLYPVKQDKQVLFKNESAKTNLRQRLIQAESHFKMVSAFFHKTVEPFFKKIQNPDETNISLYEEHKSLYEEAQAAVEQLKNQINIIDSTTIVSNSNDNEIERIPNLNTEIVNQIAENLGLQFVSEKNLTGFENLVGLKTFAPIDIFDYIYAVLHSPSYREKYKEFLKIDFPRVPYPCKDAKYCVSTFWQLVQLGGELRQIHLLESPLVEKFITEYPVDGNHIVTKPHFVLQNLTGFENLLGLGRVYINENQYFDKVPEVAWNFYIGGYQPAQKWLKDRKDRKLEFTDIQHYQKIIVALCETDRLMKLIDTIEIE